MASGLEQLRTFVQDIAKKENYVSCKIDIKPMSSGGANYTANLYLITISEPLKPDINMFAKVANLGKDMTNSGEMMGNAYEAEAKFYTELVDNFERIYNKCQVPLEDRLATAKYYGHALVPPQEFLVLEDLEANGFKNFDRMNTFNWDYASAAVTQLAKFHAIGLAVKYDNPHEFETIVSHFKFDPIEDEAVTNFFLKVALENGCQGLDSEDKERLQKYFSSTYNVTMLSKMTKDGTFLIHGDFRPSNLMHRRRKGKLQIVPLDYQTIKTGNPIGDLMHFIFCGSDAEFRRLHYEQLMEHYFKQLTLALQQLQIDVEKVYPRKTFDADLIKMRPLGLFVGLAMAAILTVNPEDASKFDGNISSMQFKPNQLAIDRTKGIVKDYVRWGVL